VFEQQEPPRQPAPAPAQLVACDLDELDAAATEPAPLPTAAAAAAPTGPPAEPRLHLTDNRYIHMPRFAPDSWGVDLPAAAAQNRRSSGRGGRVAQAYSNARHVPLRHATSRDAASLPQRPSQAAAALSSGSSAPFPQEARSSAGDSEALRKLPRRSTCDSKACAQSEAAQSAQLPGAAEQGPAVKRQRPVLLSASELLSIAGRTRHRTPPLGSPGPPAGLTRNVSGLQAQCPGHAGKDPANCARGAVLTHPSDGLISPLEGQEAAKEGSGWSAGRGGSQEAPVPVLVATDIFE
jgi:hypothetical protein